MVKNKDDKICAAHANALISYGLKLKRLTASLVGCAQIKHDRIILNDMPVERGGGPVFEDLDNWNDGFDSGAMLLFNSVLTPSERDVNYMISHDAFARFAEIGECPAPVFIAMVFDKMAALGVSDLGRFCDPGFCVVWEGCDGKRHFTTMGAYASEHAGSSVYKGLLSGELEYLCVFGPKNDRKSLARSFAWDNSLGDMP